MVKMCQKIVPIETIGIVIPVDWDDNGNPKAFAISTYDEEEFLINDETLIGKRLTVFSQQKVKLTGTLGHTINNRRVITVSQYEVI